MKHQNDDDDENTERFLVKRRLTMLTKLVFDLERVPTACGPLRTISSLCISSVSRAPRPSWECSSQEPSPMGAASCPGSRRLFPIFPR